MKKFKKVLAVTLFLMLLGTEIVSVVNIPLFGISTAVAAPSGDVLKLTVQNDGSTLDKSIKVHFSNASYTFVAGDYIEYDVKLAGSVWRAGAVDIQATDGTYFSDSYGFGDQNSLNGSPRGDLSKYASNTWYHRKIKVPGSMVGKTVSKWLLYNKNNMNGLIYVGYYDNIQVTNGSGTVKLTAYGDGNPGANSVLSQAGITSSKLESLSINYESGSPSGDVLKFTVTNASTTGDNKFNYWKVSNAGASTYTFASGDYVEYDVMLKGPVDSAAGGIDIKMTDGSYFRDAAGWQDQRALSGHPATDITKYADGVWYHRKLQVPSSMVGKVISYWDVVGENDASNKVYSAYYDNIKVTNGGNIKLTAYSDGAPSLNASDFSNNATAVLTTQLFASNTGTQSGDILSFLVLNAAEADTGEPRDWSVYTNKFVYWQVSNSAYTIADGDYLEYDIKIDPVQGAYHPGVGVDLGFSDGTFARDAAGWEDQNGLSGHPAGDVSKYASNNWYHRKMKFPSSLIGKVVSKWLVVSEHDGDSNFIKSHFDNIKITRGGAMQATAYADGIPSKNQLDFKNAVNYAVLAVEPLSGYAAAAPAVVTTSLATDDVPIASFNVMNFGAVKDGTTDDTYAFQKALYAAKAAGGGVVFAPAGSYAIREHLFIPNGVTLRGDWQNPDSGGLGLGTILKAYENKGNEAGNSFIGLDGSSALTNLTIWYPEQSYTSVSAYPWTIQVLFGDNAAIRNITLINPYKGIQASQNWNELEYFNNVYGTPLRKGIEIDFNTDIFRFENISFKPDYWSNSGLAGAPSSGTALQTLKDYMTTNAEGIIVGRADWGYMYKITLRSFATGIKYVRKFSVLGGPDAGNGSMAKVDIDEGKVGLQVEELNKQGLAISDSIIKATIGTDPVAIKTTSTFASYVGLNKVTIGGTPHTAARLQGSGVVSFQNCTFTDWGYQGGTYAIDAQAGSIIVDGNDFQKNAKSIRIPSTIVAATVMGNTFNGTPQIDDTSGKAIPYVWIDHSAFNFDQMPTTGHVYRSSIPKPPNNNFYNVKASPYNAVGDGNADDTTAFQNALNAAGGASGGTVYAPAGRYRINGTLSVPANVELRGIFDTPHHTMGEGSVLFAYSGKGSETGTPFITLAQNAGIRGMTIYYPEQDHTNFQQYPWTIRGNGSGVYAINTTLSNSWQGIDFGYTNPSDNHYINGVNGVMLKRGVYAGKSATEGWMENVHMNPHFWMRTPYIGSPDGIKDEWLNTLLPQLRGNVEGIIIGSANNEHILGFFIFGAYNGIRTEAQGTGKPNATLYLAGLDSLRVGVNIGDVGTTGIDFIGAQFIISDGNAQRGYVVVGSGSTGATRLFNSTDGDSTWSIPVIGIEVNGGTNNVFQQFNVGKPSDRYVKAYGGSTKVDNFYVQELSNDAYAGPNINSIRFVGGASKGGFDIVNDAGSKASWYGNVTIP
ncbi:MAG TPA: glycosyl hydrolase family 28-related protein [Bacilli bacterium]